MRGGAARKGSSRSQPGKPGRIASATRRQTARRTLVSRVKGCEGSVRFGLSSRGRDRDRGGGGGGTREESPALYVVARAGRRRQGRRRTPVVRCCGSVGLLFASEEGVRTSAVRMGGARLRAHASAAGTVWAERVELGPPDERPGSPAARARPGTPAGRKQGCLATGNEDPCAPSNSDRRSSGRRQGERGKMDGAGPAQRRAPGGSCRTARSMPTPAARAGQSVRRWPAVLWLATRAWSRCER